MTGRRPTIDELVVGDEPAAWAAAGFTVDDDGTCRIGAVRVRLAGRADRPGLRAWSLRGIDPPADDAVDGLPTTASDRAPVEPATHANGVTGLDHVVLFSSDGPRTAAAITQAAGLDVRRIREAGTDGARMRQWFFRLGAVILELVAPDEGDGRPTAFFGLAMNVDDIDALPGLYGEQVTTPKDAVQPGRRIASLRHRALDISVPIAFMTPEPPRS